MKRFVQRGGLWVIAQILLMCGVAVCGVLFRSAHRSPAATLAGGLLLALAAMLALAGALTLGRGLTPCLSPSGEAKLVCAGVYSIMRHPIYSGLMVAGYGWALVWQSWPAFAVATVLVPFFNAKAVREEEWLRKHVPAYDDYAKRVRRFVPWIY